MTRVIEKPTRRSDHPHCTSSTAPVWATSTQAILNGKHRDVIAKPEVGLVAVSGAGYYSAIMGSGTLTGDLITDALAPPPMPRAGGIRCVAAVDGHAYAGGLRGIAYFLSDNRKWVRIDDGRSTSMRLLGLTNMKSTPSEAMVNYGIAR
jgi:hypothetical protein